MWKIKRLLQQKLHPSWCVAAIIWGIIGGMIFIVVTRQNLITHWVWLVVAGILIAVAIIWPIGINVGLAFMAGFLIASYRASFDLVGQQELAALIGEQVEIKGTIAEDPDQSETKTALRLKKIQIGDKEIAGTIYVQLAVNELPERSDEITLRGKLNEGFGTFAATMYRPSVIKIERPEPGDILLHLRNWFSENVKKYVESPAAELGLGYLLGVRSNLPTSLLETLKIVGLTHIIVASGANLAILIGFARKLFGRVSRWMGFVMAMALTLMMVGIIGFTPSMARAAAVSILSLLTWYSGRKFEPLRLLSLVAAITLLFNPMYLLDMGWLLSFASFAGIMIVGPIITQFFYGTRKPNFLMQTLIETVAASLMCLPILLYSFGMLSLISLLANLLILPTIPVAMALTFATGVLNVVPWLATISGKLAELLLNFHLWIINFLGQRTEFLITVETGCGWVFLWYVPMVALIVWDAIKRRRLAFLPSEQNIDIGRDNANQNNWRLNSGDKVANLNREAVKSENLSEWG